MSFLNKIFGKSDEGVTNIKEVELTALFSSVVPFSQFSDKLSPHQLIHVMNSYLTAMTDAIMKENGSVLKYIGDAVSASFGEPVKLDNHAHAACCAALGMQEVQKVLNQEFAKTDMPDIVARMRTAIGINTGTAIIGDMGTKHLRNYTMMGDNINLASRLGAGGRSYGVLTVTTGETKEMAEKAKNYFCFRYLDKVIIKGRAQPAVLYELLNPKTMTEEQLEGLAAYNKGIASYLEQDWDTAEDALTQAALVEMNKDILHTTPSKVMLERVKDYREDPPGDGWDGVYVMRNR